MNKIIEKDKKYLIQCYTTDDIAFTNAKGMYLYDSEGNKYGNKAFYRRIWCTNGVK